MSSSDSTSDFSAWLNSVVNNGESNVPCRDCVACCTSSYFIHISPDEQKTLSLIPKEILFPAPGAPKGHVLMGYDENGHCPMFKNNACSIYESRPKTCREYDCRIFTATDLVINEEREHIKQQASQWKFTPTNEKEKNILSSIKSAALFLEKNQNLFPSGFIPGNPTQRAALALRIHPFFLDTPIKPPNKLIQSIIDSE